MTFKASRPAAWILAAGLIAFMGTPAFAAEGSVWPTVTGATAAQLPAADGQQAAPNAAAALADQNQAATNTATQPDSTERSLSAEQRPADATAPAETADASTAQVASDQGSGWDKASIVGKIFIAAGTLLTLGSAARMFMI
jgi:hypothetical protein